MKIRLLATLIAISGIAAYAVVKKNFGAPQIKGEVNDSHLPEVSGLVRSIRKEGYLWAHNDSGNLPEIYLIDTNGHLLKTFNLQGAANLDWEDIAIGTEKNGVSYVYVGDIGDNFGFLPYRTIYKLKEPAMNDAKEITHFEKMLYKYEDGSRDAETLMIAPDNGDVIVVSKRDDAVHVYSSAFKPFKNENDTVHLKKLGELQLTQIVGGDISPDGKEMLMKNYHNVYYWDLQDGNWKVILKDKPQIISSYVVEPQGESICWDFSGRGFYTLSEYANHGKARLYYYPQQ